jgi:hypothetical protein
MRIGLSKKLFPAGDLKNKFLAHRGLVLMDSYCFSGLANVEHYDGYPSRAFLGRRRAIPITGSLRDTLIGCLVNIDNQDCIIIHTNLNGRTHRRSR